MFTGIISDIGTIVSAQQHGDLRVAIACHYPPESIHIGESIACNGACMTDKGIGDWALGIREGNANPQSPMPNACFTIELSAESLARTAPGQWQTGRSVNLERSLKLGDTLDGHMVTGHIDAVATIHAITPTGDSHTLCLDAPPAFARFIAEKGSVTLDGIALTVNKVEASRFWVNIIPHTWQVTTLGQRQPGDQLNLEIDLIARYVARLLEK
jgi:riboflavin synthase